MQIRRWVHGLEIGTQGSNDLLSSRCPLSRLRKNALLLVLFLSPTMGWKKETVSAAATPPEVKVTPVVQEDVPLYTECIATLDRYGNAQIEPQVTGYLMKQNCREGTVVR
jgi:hypothetical protein